ncbi:MAG: hypothetical protein ACFBSF_02680 [Leptolyngbyaceae cyanobacterium]
MSLINQINADREAQKDDAIETQVGFGVHELSEIVRRWGAPFGLAELARSPL